MNGVDVMVPDEDAASLSDCKEACRKVPGSAENSLRTYKELLVMSQPPT